MRIRSSLMFMLTVTSIVTVVLAGTVSAQDRRYIGVLAVEESPPVHLAIREAGGDPAIYGPELRRLLDSGQIRPATGNYCFIPYAGGEPADRPECFRTRTGIYSMWAPAEYVAPGRAMCVQVPHNWIAIAGQTRYPRVGGGQVNCRDFGPEAVGNFATTRRTAAMIVVVEALN